MERFLTVRKRPETEAKTDGSVTVVQPALKRPRTQNAPAAGGDARSTAEGSQTAPAAAEVPMHWLAQRVPEHWKPYLGEQCSYFKFRQLALFLSDQLVNNVTVFPPLDKVYAALDYCRIATGETGRARAGGPAEISVVILGQDPYVRKGQAHGLSFSVEPGTPVPPSLANVFLELTRDLGSQPKPTQFEANTGCLTGWARQGVLLLNTCLTVEAFSPASHANKGWEHFTDGIIEAISKRSAKPVVFLLWGAHAQSKKHIIDTKKHLVLETSHPSPKSATKGFLGCGHFSKTNAFLLKNNRRPIDWTRLSDSTTVPTEAGGAVITIAAEPAGDGLGTDDPPLAPSDQDSKTETRPQVLPILQ